MQLIYLWSQNMSQENFTFNHRKEIDVLSKEERLSIERLKDPIQEIIQQLMKEIDEGKYRVLVGDDASGRIPTLIMANVINALYERNGYPHPFIRFVAGSTFLYDQEVLDEKQQKITHHMGTFNIEKKDEHRALVITDTIDSGASVRMMMNSLKESGIMADVAAVSVRVSSLKRELESEFGCRVVYGFEGLPDIYGKEFSGVKKESHNLFAEPRIKNRNNPELQQKINTARTVAKTVAQEIINTIPDAL